MADELIRPIDEDTAKAIQEVARLASKIVDASSGIGRYLDRVFRHVPDNLVGYLGGDWLAEQRTRKAERLRAETEEIRRRRGTKEKVDVSPSIAIPLVQGAIDEDRDGLRQLWAQLLAAAMDPDRAHLVRLSFIEVAKKMDPLDAAVLRSAQGTGGAISGTKLNDLAMQLEVSRDEIDVSVANLAKLELVRMTHGPEAVVVPFGREFLRTVAD